VTLLLEAQREGTVSPRRAQAILGEHADDELELLSTHPEIVVRTRGGWQLARSPGELYVADVRARFGVPSGATLDDTASLQTLASLAKQANDSGSFRRSDPARKGQATPTP